VRWLSDAAVDHLRAVADRPDIGGTPYELAEAIARGGMGTVYRARDRRLAAKYHTPLLLVAAYLLMRIVLALVARV
jgi:hypothetical protein